MASYQEGGAPLRPLLDKVRVGQAARLSPDLDLGEGELHVQSLEIGKDQLRHGT